MTIQEQADAIMARYNLEQQRAMADIEACNILRKMLASIDRAPDRECWAALEEQARALLAKIDGAA